MSKTFLLRKEDVVRRWLHIDARDVILGKLAVHAAVAPKAGETLSPEDLLEHCAAQLSRFKRPKRIHVMAGLPRGNLGKVSIETLKKSVGPEG